MVAKVVIACRRAPRATPSPMPQKPIAVIAGCLLLLALGLLLVPALLHDASVRSWSPTDEVEVAATPVEGETAAAPIAVPGLNRQELAATAAGQDPRITAR